MLIGGFQPFSLSDFPGRAAAIVFTQGCNFRCPYCHNRQLWQNAVSAAVDTEETVLAFLKSRKGKLDGVVITGGEPTLQPDLISFIRKIREMGFAVKLDTNGSRPEIIASLQAEGLVDYIAMDIKAPPGKYEQLCGVTVDPHTILLSMHAIAASHIPHHFRTTWYRQLLTEEDLETIRAILPEQSRYLVQKCRNHVG